MPDQNAPQPPAPVTSGSAPTPAPAATPTPGGVPAAAAPGAQPTFQQRVDTLNSHLPSVGEALSNLAHLIPGFAGYKAVDKYIAEEGEVIPLFQYVQPIIHKKSVKVTAQSSGMILPQLITPA